MTRSEAFETFVGLLVIAIAAGFMYYAYGVSGTQFGAKQYRVDAVFGRVDGITLGSEVRSAGVKIGSVSGIALNQATYEADLRLAIDRRIAIPEDSAAKIVSDGLLGGAHVSIEPGASEDMLQDGDRITITQGSVDLLNMAVTAFTENSNNGDDN